MTPCPPLERLQQFLGDELSAADEPDIAMHVQDCPGCTKTLEQLTTQAPPDGDSPRTAREEPGPAFLERLQELSPFPRGLSGVQPSAEGPPWPAIPNYEILRLLGKGGMGVVYEARDLTLKRVVAIKMVLAGGRTGGEQLARFRAEAEAVARLEHPHIVQVFTGGEHDGQPYFVMQCVEGGSLDKKLQGEAQPPRDAARLVLLLARAVHAAHQAGIVHRDLKPANVLLAPAADEPALNCAYGCPRLTDFGLSKCLDSTGDPTATGTVLGTPAYMAPEQATGDTEAIRPATDVWALGIILYEMLTGVVPFKGMSVFETLRQICSSQPELPRRRCPVVPRDLEAICMKCMQKAPGERYATAAALADDLSRFLAEAPVSAPPARQVSRLQARRRLMAALAATLVLVTVGGAFLIAQRSDDSPTTSEQPPESSRRIPRVLPEWEGSLDLRVTEPGNSRRRELLLHQPGALPLRAKMQMRIEAEVNRPAFLYLVYLDSQGKVTPLFPWQNHDWKQRPKEEERRQRLVRSGNLDPSPSGVESLLLLVRGERLPDTVDLAALFSGLPRQKGLPDPQARAWFENGELVKEEQDRGPLRIGQEDTRDNPVLQTQQLLRQKLSVLFPYTRAVCFAFQGD